MSDELKWGLGGLGVGVGLGAVGYALFMNKDNDDRPPIIVRGGSLIFQSGVNAKHPGKPWKRKPNSTEWQMIHPQGKPTNAFLVMMPGSGRCGPAFVDSLTLEYTLTSGGTATFRVVRRARLGGGRPAPAIIGDDLAEDNSLDTPTLTFPRDGRLTRVWGGSVDCQSPGEFQILSVK